MCLSVFEKLDSSGYSLLIVMMMMMMLIIIIIIIIRMDEMAVILRGLTPSSKGDVYGL